MTPSWPEGFPFPSCQERGRHSDDGVDSAGFSQWLILSWSSVWCIQTGDNNGFVVGWVGGLGDQRGHLGPRVDGEYRQLAVKLFPLIVFCI